MNYNIISSGSKGNAVVINDCIMIDCGVPFKALSAVYKNIKIVFLSHNHGDHFNRSTIRRLSKERPTLRWACCEWLVKDLVYCGVSLSMIDILPFEHINDYGLFTVQVFPTPHNVPNCGFIFDLKGEMLFYATDCNSLDHVKCQNADMYMIEANYRESEIAERIASKKANGEHAYELEVIKNHLSEEKALAWICENAGENSQYILMHRHEVENAESNQTM